MYAEWRRRGHTSPPGPNKSRRKWARLEVATGAGAGGASTGPHSPVYNSELQRRAAFFTCPRAPHMLLRCPHRHQSRPDFDERPYWVYIRCLFASPIFFNVQSFATIYSTIIGARVPTQKGSLFNLDLGGRVKRRRTKVCRSLLLNRVDKN